MRTEKVAMRDGVKLATDVYLPAKDDAPLEGRFPVLVTRSPYNKNGEKRRGQYFAAHGYVFVAQDTRGRYQSEGEPYPLIHEGKDGYDTIEWAAAQPWSNGKIGTTGASYLAMDQYAAAIESPPHLVAMYAAVGGANYYYDAGYRGGIPGLGWPVWLLLSAATDPHADVPTRDRLNEMVKHPDAWLSQTREKRAEAFKGFPVQLKAYRDFYAHPDYDAYWKQTGFDTSDYYNRIPDIPIFFVSGWYDSFAEATLENFTALRKIQKTEKRLLMGPWPHGYGKSQCGDESFGAEAELDENPLQLDWFDHWMKAQPYARIGTKPVRYFLMGRGWQTAEAWPPDHSDVERFELRGGSYSYDPANPVHTLGGRYDGECIQNQNVARPDILTTLGAPLKTAMNVTGTVRAELWVSSDAPSADLVVKLIDVRPDGYAAPILDGAQRVRMHGKAPQEVVIGLGTTSNVFERGHRIRVDVTSSSFPKLEPNPNRARITLQRGTVELPVIPAALYGRDLRDRSAGS